METQDFCRVRNNEEIENYCKFEKLNIGQISNIRENGLNLKKIADFLENSLELSELQAKQMMQEMKDRLYSLQKTGVFKKSRVRNRLYPELQNSKGNFKNPNKKY